MQPSSLDFEQIISKPRLDSYRAYWKATPDEAVGLYMWNGEVCAEMAKLLQHFEVALRNNIHREMSLNVSRGASSSMHWWDALWTQLSADTQNKINDVRNKATSAPSPDEIVSRLSFGFWPNMLNWIAKQRTSVMFRILPGHPLSQPGAARDWTVPRARKPAIQAFFELKEVRNRIAHHEPLWKFGNLVDTSAGGARIVVPASVNEATSLSRFARLLTVYDGTVHAVSPALHACISGSSWRARLNFLLTTRGIDRFRNGAHVPEVLTITPLALRQQFASVVRGNRPVKLLDHGGEGIFIPA